MACSLCIDFVLICICLSTSRGLKPSEMSFLACRVVRMATIAFTFGMMPKCEECNHLTNKRSDSFQVMKWLV